MTLAEKIGLHRPTLRAWALYDWANSAFVTIIVAAIFPAYFAKVANASDIVHNPAVATQRLALTTIIALAIIALFAPILGTIADTAPIKKKMLAVFMLIGVSATAGMYALGPDQWLLACILFALGNVGAMGSFIFYDSLLPHIASPSEVDRVSTAGYALGYVAGGILLIAAIVVIEHPSGFGLTDKEQASRVVFVAVALWWLLWSIPLFRIVPEPPVSAPPAHGGGYWILAVFTKLLHTFRELQRYPHAKRFLLAFLIYNDGVGTIIKFAVIYGEEIGIQSSDMIKAIVLVQFVGIPCTALFGQLAKQISARKAIYLGLVVYAGVSILGYFMTTSSHFFCLAALIGLVQGGVQALSRSLFSTMIPRQHSSEFFALFSVFEKFAGIAGPLLFATVISLAGSSRPAILAILVFFAVGAMILSRVGITEGQKQAGYKIE